MDTPIPQTWINGVLSALVGICMFFIRGYVKKVDTIGANYVTRAQLTETFAEHDKRVSAMHTDNTNNFRELRQQLDGINSKLFDLARKTP